MDYKRWALIFVAALLALGLWLCWLWQPERQVRLRTVNLIKMVERRKWTGLREMLAEDYSDRWGHDKEFVLGTLPTVFQQFIVVNVEQEVTAVSANPQIGRSLARIKISGQGGPIAQYVMSKVNGLSEPFTFKWKKSGGRPWEWVLIGVDHPSLQIGNDEPS